MNDMSEQHQKLEYWLKGAMPRLSHEEREALWASVAFRLAPHAPRVARRVHTAVAGAVAIGLFSSSILTVYASDAAVPGDLLYPLDRVIEEVRVAVALTEEQKERVRVAQAYERLEEVRIILERAPLEKNEDDAESDETIDARENAFQVATQTVSTGSEFQDDIPVSNHDDAASGEENKKRGKDDAQIETEQKTDLGAKSGPKSSAARQTEQIISRTIVDLQRAKDSLRREDRKEEIERVVREIEEARAERMLERQKMKEERQKKLEGERSQREREKNERARGSARQEKESESRPQSEGGNIQTSVTVSFSPNSPNSPARPAENDFEERSLSHPPSLEDGVSPASSTMGMEYVKSSAEGSVSSESSNDESDLGDTERNNRGSVHF